MLTDAGADSDATADLVAAVTSGSAWLRYASTKARSPFFTSTAARKGWRDSARISTSRRPVATPSMTAGAKPASLPSTRISAPVMLERTTKMPVGATAGAISTSTGTVESGNTLTMRRSVWYPGADTNNTSGPGRTLTDP